MYIENYRFHRQEIADESLIQLKLQLVLVCYGWRCTKTNQIIFILRNNFFIHRFLTKQYQPSIKLCRVVIDHTLYFSVYIGKENRQFDRRILCLLFYRPEILV